MDKQSILSAEEPAVETGTVEVQEIVEPAQQEQVNSGAGTINESGEISFDGIVGKDGALSENWRNSLPENIRGEKSLDSIKHFSTLAQSYVHAQKSIGSNKVAIPSEHATPEEKSAFYNAIGRPESPEKYDISTPTDIPEGLVFNDESVNEFKQFAFEHGLSNEQASKAVEFQGKMLAKQYQEAQAQAEAEYSDTEAKLKAEFGGEYNNVISQANKALSTFGVGKTLEESGLLNNYDVIKMFSKIGASLSESKLKNDGQPVSSSAQSRYDELIGDTNSAYYRNDHPLHEQAVKEVTRLITTLHASDK